MKIHTRKKFELNEYEIKIAIRNHIVNKFKIDYSVLDIDNIDLKYISNGDIFSAIVEINKYKNY